MQAKEKNIVLTTAQEDHSLLPIVGRKDLPSVVKDCANYTYNAPLLAVSGNILAGSRAIFDICNVHYPNSWVLAGAAATLEATTSNLRTKPKFFKKGEMQPIVAGENTSDIIQFDVSLEPVREIIKIVNLDIIKGNRSSTMSEISRYVYRTLVKGDIASVKLFIKLFLVYPFSIDAMVMLVSITKPYKEILTDRKDVVDRLLQAIHEQKWSTEEVNNLLDSLE